MSTALSNAIVGRWCGGVHVTPAGLAGPAVLAATPVYLDTFDALHLFVLAAGGARDAADLLAEYDPEALDTFIAERTAATAHDRIVSHWDHQPS